MLLALILAAAETASSDSITGLPPWAQALSTAFIGLCAVLTGIYGYVSARKKSAGDTPDPPDELREIVTARYIFREIRDILKMIHGEVIKIREEQTELLEIERDRARQEEVNREVARALEGERRQQEQLRQTRERRSRDRETPHP